MINRPALFASVSTCSHLHLHSFFPTLFLGLVVSFNFLLILTSSVCSSHIALYGMYITTSCGSTNHNGMFFFHSFFYGWCDPSVLPPTPSRSVCMVTMHHTLPLHTTATPQHNSPPLLNVRAMHQQWRCVAFFCFPLSFTSNGNIPVPPCECSPLSMQTPLPQCNGDVPLQQ